jgi:hypothetical protein
MPLCKIRTSRLTYREIYRINGPIGFPIVGLLKLLRCDFPTTSRYFIPCSWSLEVYVPERSLADCDFAAGPYSRFPK